MVLNNGLGVFWVEGNWDLTKRQWRKSQLSMRSFLFRRMNRRGNLYAHSSHFVLYCVVKMLVKSCTFQILGLFKTGDIFVDLVYSVLFTTLPWLCIQSPMNSWFSTWFPSQKSAFLHYHKNSLTLIQARATYQIFTYCNNNKIHLSEKHLMYSDIGKRVSLRFCTHFIFIVFSTRPNFRTSL